MKSNRLWLVACVGLVLSGCAVNPATGARELMLVSEGQEIQMGLQSDPAVVQTFGMYPDSSIQQYVRGLGERLAARSERPNLPWTFRVVDDPVVNAFALPGGFIYITRGIMAYFNSEAELVSVLGHEIGHVTARHSAQQMSQQQLAQVGMVATAILVPETQDYLGIAGAGLQLLFLKFSRDDERQADDLGFRYMTRLNYDPREMPGVFAMLGRVSAASGGGGTPGWLSTHPDPEDREQRIAARIDSVTIPQNAIVNQAAYLRRLDGLTFGVNPREGFFREQLFLHPDLQFRMDFPSGWKTANQKQGVIAQSPQQDAIVQLTLAQESTANGAAQTFTTMEGVTAGYPQSTSINGNPAAVLSFSAATEQGTLSGMAVFIEYGGMVYQLLGFAPAARWGSYQSTVQRAFWSFDRLTDRAALAVQPLRLDIVTLDRRMTLAQFNQRYPSQVPIETISMINGVDAATSLASGTLVKRVVGGPLP
jgi:predicted Zn-dependent protease